MPIHMSNTILGLVRHITIYNPLQRRPPPHHPHPPRYCRHCHRHRQPQSQSWNHRRRHSYHNHHRHPIELGKHTQLAIWHQV